MCSLPLNQLCSKLVLITRIKKKLPKQFLQQLISGAGNRKSIFAREPVRQITIAMNINNAFLGTNRLNPFHYRKFGLEQITLRRNGLPIASIQLVHKIVNFSSSTHYQIWVCCTAGWESLRITTSSTFLCVSISLAHSIQLMTFCIHNLLTAQFHSSFNSQTL